MNIKEFDGSRASSEKEKLWVSSTGVRIRSKFGGLYYPPRRLTRFIDPEQGVGMT